VEHHEVVVVGAGVSGVGAAVRLREQGVDDVLVLEAADDVGGTWRANTYPGCACDVPSLLYSYSFAPHPGWSTAFAGQREILAYVRSVVDDHGLRPVIRLGTRLTAARWDPAAGHWRLETDRGELTARFLVAAAGPWNEPRVPDVPGLSSFPGPVFHSARWDHSADLTGKRVVVVGSGASAVQFVPAVQPEVARLHLFQRTAQWVLPKPSYPTRWSSRVPGARRVLRGLEYAAMETMGVGIRHPRLIAPLQAAAAAYLRSVVRDPVLRAALTPDYTLGCKRILFSSSYLQALTRPGVAVHPTAVTSVEGSTVVGADGTRVEADVIILGTGFRILDMPLGEIVHDAGGRSLSDHWAGSPEAHQGTLVPGFPNLFLLLGPGLGTGHTSAFTILEAQLELVCSAVQAARDAGVTVEVRREAHERFVASLQAALAGTVYNAGGCRSYYLDENGRNSFSWPWSTRRLVRRVSRFEPAHHLLEPVHTPTSVPTPVAEEALP
jgi:cyclohexanone monooxygenase